MMNIAKFGGSSVKDAAAFLRCVNIIEKGPHTAVVILSATYNTTNDLEEFFTTKSPSITERIINRHIKIARDLDIYNDEVRLFLEQRLTDLKTLDVKDDVLAVGERISSFLFFTLLKRKLQREVALLNACDLIKLSGDIVDDVRTEECCQRQCLSLIENDTLIITQGFIGENELGRTVTLGREGSDYSATIIGAALNAGEVHIWTDIDGIYDADPRFISEARKFDHLDYKQASDLARAGAKVLFSKTLEPLFNKETIVRVRSSLDIEKEGTTISKTKKNDIRAVTAKSISNSLDQITIIDSKNGHQTFDIAPEDRQKALQDFYKKYITETTDS